MDYQAGLAFLAGRVDFERVLAIPYAERDYKLDRMRELLARLGDPERGLSIVHVAGTKGKGSTSAAVAAMLTAAGYRTGLFTSPHLYRVEERIAVDGVPISADELTQLVAHVLPHVEAMDGTEGPSGQRSGPTYFDLTTAMALVHFRQRHADAVVLEVGLGGRLDSTNACQPLVSVITSISLDHTQQLGDTLGKIADEKAGIIKPGVPVVSGVTEAEPRNRIRAVAREQHSRIIELESDFHVDYRPPRAVDQGGAPGTLRFEYPQAPAPFDHLDDVRLGMLGRHQAQNAGVALAVAAELQTRGWNIPEDAARRALAELCWPARIELVRRRPAVVVDAAHNVASAAALVEVLSESFVSQPRTLIFGATRDKDAAGMLRLLLPQFDRTILTRYTINPRSVPPEELLALARPLADRPLVVCPDPPSAWQEARAAATADALICITGSFYMAAELRAAIDAT